MNRTRLVSVTALIVLIAASLHAHPVVKSDARARMQQVTPDQMQQVILNYMRSHKDGTVADVQVHLLEPEETVSLPAGTLDMRVVPSPAAEGYGRRHIDVALSLHGKVIHIVKALADVTEFVDVAAATRAIRIDETIQPDDVTLTRIPLIATARQYATNLDEVIGKRAARPLASHAPISVSALGEPFLVRKGDHVTIEAKRKGLLVQTIGITKAVGQVGQMVTVTNQDSGKDLRAKVIGPGLVRVEF
ncbi:MAG TPA: flagellar basal body P-ring formation chaperone FlgA [Nitrospiraceae bacterium]|nr:flagellar basal body P-ring formation chaperone FlgA [Nitrospiraceae bacterium]